MKNNNQLMENFEQLATRFELSVSKIIDIEIARTQDHVAFAQEMIEDYKKRLSFSEGPELKYIVEGLNLWVTLLEQDKQNIKILSNLRRKTF